MPAGCAYDGDKLFTVRDGKRVLIEGLLERLLFLSYGLAAILAFIGIKLVLHALHENNVPFINEGEPVNVIEITTVTSANRAAAYEALVQAEQAVRALPEEYRAMIEERQTLREMLADAHARRAARPPTASPGTA